MFDGVAVSVVSCLLGLTRVIPSVKLSVTVFSVEGPLAGVSGALKSLPVFGPLFVSSKSLVVGGVGVVKGICVPLSVCFLSNPVAISVTTSSSCKESSGPSPHMTSVSLSPVSVVTVWVTIDSSSILTSCSGE